MSSLRRLLGYLRPYLAWMVLGSLLLAVAGGLISVVVSTLEPLVNEVLFGRAAEAVVETAPKAAMPDPMDRVRSWVVGLMPDGLTHDRSYITVPLAIVLVFLVRSVLLFFGTYLINASGSKVIRDLRAELYESIIFQSQNFFHDHSSGSLLSRLLNDVQRLERLSTATLAHVVRVGATIPFVLAVILIHDWRMSVFALVALPVMILPVLRLGGGLRKAWRRSQQYLGDVSSRASETLGGIKVVQGFAMERFEIRQFRATLEQLLRMQLRAAKAAALSPAVIELTGALAGAVLFYVAGRSISSGSLDAGDFAVVLVGLGLLFVALRRLTQSNIELQQGLASADRIFEVLDCERQIQDRSGARPAPEFVQAVCFEGVEFSYGDEMVLRGIDLEIAKGEMLALVGLSGSGKTTMANLLLRFQDPTVGRITLDGVDLRDLELRSLRDQIGLVTQETVLFDETVRDNIAYGRADIDEDRIQAAARAAQAHGFIEALPHGYGTRLGERGQRLSMGQRQRIAIARALLKDPPLLILDEATSSLDSQSEAKVQEALDTLLEGRTSLVIAHRLATVSRADRICVLSEGRIQEIGTHAELLAREGLYARLYRLQFRDPLTHPAGTDSDAEPRQVASEL